MRLLKNCDQNIFTKIITSFLTEESSIFELFHNIRCNTEDKIRNKNFELFDLDNCLIISQCIYKPIIVTSFIFLSLFLRFAVLLVRETVK